jgi:hypothetical protein
MKGLKSAVGAIAVILSLLYSSIAATQQTAAATPATQGWVTVHIAPQPLRDALRVFADQTQLQVVYRSEQIDPTVTCAAVVGTYRAEEALARLLGKSDLRAVRINARTLAIHGVSNHSRRRSDVVSASSPTPDPTDPE